MKSIKTKLSFIILFIILTIILMTVNTFASNENVALVKVDADYLIYIQNLENKDFKFTFTNDSKITAEEAVEKLKFISNWEDTNKVNVACLEKENQLDLTKNIYMWIQTDKETYSVQLNLEDAISKEEIAQIESLTNLIAIDAKQTTTTVKNEEGITKAETIGQINITDNKEASYKYQLIKLDANQSEATKKFMEEVNILTNKYGTMTMYEKVLEAIKTKKLYSEVEKESKWLDVEDMTIYQPKNSEQGDKYLVLIEQLSDGKVIKKDIKFLTSTKEKEQEVVQEEKEVKKTSTLPVTYDSAILFIILAAIVTIAIIAIVRMRKLNAEKDTK